MWNQRSHEPIALAGWCCSIQYTLQNKEVFYGRAKMRRGGNVSNISDNKFYEFIFIKSSDKDDLIKGNYYKNHSIMGSRLKPLITNTLKKYL